MTVIHDNTERRYKVEDSPSWSIAKRDHGCDYTLKLWGRGRCSLAEGQWHSVKTKERAELLGRHWVATGIDASTACKLSDDELLSDVADIAAVLEAVS